MCVSDDGVAFDVDRYLETIAMSSVKFVIQVRMWMTARCCYLTNTTRTRTV